MPDPIEIHRKEVAQRIQTLNAQGGWEGAHTDFKRELGSTTRDLGKLLKHVLAFSNTPRRTDAYIIFGVSEDKDTGTFQHVGTPAQGFPQPERINDIIHQYTHLKDIVIDAHHVLDGKRTPYILIPLQYEGPYRLSQPFHGLGESGEIFCRYGSSSARATERDIHHMSDWATWFLDCRYEQTPTSLMEILANRFPRHTSLAEYDGCVRLFYESKFTDAFGTHVVPALIHAYWGFDPIDPRAVNKITTDNAQPSFQKTIVGARFTAATLTAAAAASVLCVSLDEIYFVNDPYAQLCREFGRRWDNERSERRLGLILDLDFRLSANAQEPEPQHSVLSFIEEQLRSDGRTAVLIHGDFGCGKTTTAKQLVAQLSQEYLRGHANGVKLLYLDVNNLDIRSRRDECIASQLTRYSLSREQIDSLITQVRQNEIQLVFDGVDEMARPYTTGGRHEAIEILRDVSNGRAAAYLVRSAYFPELNEMLSEFGLLADHDFVKGKKRIVSAEILPLRGQQVEAYLQARLGNEDARKVRSGLHRIGFDSFLVDPLIVSFVTDLVEREGTDTIESFPQKGQKAHFLSYLVNKLLVREQEKRQRHGALAENFALFQKVLQTVAFNMVCRGASAISTTQLEAFVQRALQNVGRTSEMVASFRTMSWIRRAGTGELTFRPEALTPICAAEHLCGALASRDALAVSDWQPSAPLASVLFDYAGEMVDSSGVLGATAMLGGELQFNVRQLVRSVLETAKTRGDVFPPTQVDDTAIAGICRGIVGDVNLAKLPVQILFASLPPKRAVQVGVPLLFLLARSDVPEAINTAVAVLDVLCRTALGSRQFCEALRTIKADRSNWVDHVLLRDLGIVVPDLIEASGYEGLFESIYKAPVDTRFKQYADRTLRAIEGEKNRRAAAFREGGQRR